MSINKEHIEVLKIMEKNCFTSGRGTSSISIESKQRNFREALSFACSKLLEMDGLEKTIDKTHSKVGELKLVVKVYIERFKSFRAKNQDLTDCLSTRDHYIKELKGEVNTIKDILDKIDEFDKPMPYDCEIPELANRVFEYLCEVYSEKEGFRSKVQFLQIKYGKLKSDNSELKEDIRKLMVLLTDKSRRLRELNKN